MIIPCEVAVKSIIPAVKALLAKELLENHGMKQSQVAKILGISQSAVSKYQANVRGHVIKIEDIDEIRAQIDDMIVLLTQRKNQRTEFLKLFCQTCITIREKGLMCQFCQKSDPTIKIEECHLCLVHSKLKRK